ncbi:hypothetical protein Ddc_10266 [Ditylenchus destructor]|nr:hypothetical protein Ddc_10266 [Ditylenchus destructor]
MNIDPNSTTLAQEDVKCGLRFGDSDINRSPTSTALHIDWRSTTLRQMRSLLRPTSECTRYKTHTDFMEATNLDWTPTSIGVCDTPNNPFFVDEASDKLSLKSDSSARSAGTALPAVAYLGVPPSPIDIGALTYRDKQV